VEILSEGLNEGGFGLVLPFEARYFARGGVVVDIMLCGCGQLWACICPWAVPASLFLTATQPTIDR
jgi:hypothetical protein